MNQDQLMGLIQSEQLKQNALIKLLFNVSDKIPKEEVLDYDSLREASPILTTAKIVKAERFIAFKNIITIRFIINGENGPKEAHGFIVNFDNDKFFVGGESF